MKLTKEARSSMQSARAKNRKTARVLGEAAAEHGIKVPKTVVAHVEAIEAYFAKALAAKK